MLKLKEGKKAVSFARDVIENHVKQKEPSSLNSNEVFEEKHGAFVTIHTYPEKKLRGCIGIPMPKMKLKEAIKEGAKSATNDPRFSPLSEEELGDIIIEVTVLTKPEKIEVEKPKKYLSNIEIGRDGLIVEQRYNRGLLLPQVPVDQGWDKEDFLSQTCVKAGLMPDAWLKNETKIFRFSGQIFAETKPYGEIKEKKIDGSGS